MRLGSPPATLRSTLLDAAWAGFLFVGLGYGAALAALHLRYNQVGSLAEGTFAYLNFALIYGLWGAATFGGGLVLAGIQRWLTPRRRVPQGHDARFAALRRSSVFWGVLVFHLVYWGLFFLYGLTYDQTRLYRPQGGWGMAAYLLVFGFLILAAVALTAKPFSRALAALGESRPRWVVTAVLVVAGLGLNLAAVATGGGDESSQQDSAAAPAPPEVTRATEGAVKVAFVGFDGADWQVLRPMVEAGALPHFAEIMEEGVSASLETLPDSNSAVIWASIYSGTEPDAHGIHDFYRVELPGLPTGLFPVHRTFFKELAGPLEKIGLARRTPVSRFSMQRLPLWEIADHAGLSIGVVDGYFYSFPALPIQNEESYFVAYGADDFADRLNDPDSSVRQDDLGLFVQPPPLFRQLRPALAKDDFYWQSEALLGPLSELPQPDFLNFYTHQPDSFQHWYWKWLEPARYLRVTEEGLQAHGEKIGDLYRDFDRFLGELRQSLDPETVLVIASDHGHSPTLVHSFYTQHRHGPPGILLMAGGPVRRGAEIQKAHVYDLFPTMLHLLGLPIPGDGDGELLRGALDPAWLEAHPPRRLPTYEGLWPSPWQGATQRDSESNRMEIEKLKALGYI